MWSSSTNSWLLLLLCCGAVSMVWADTCTIDGGTRQQVMDGFGFSTAWCGKLSSAKNNALYNTLGMSILRIRVDENGNWNDERDNTAAAHAAGAKVFGTSWTAPPKWNSNGKSTGGYLLNQYYPDFAKWLHDAVAYIGTDYVSFINEPDFNGGNGDYMTEPNMRYFLKTYGKQLGKPIIYPECVNFNDAWSDPALNDPEAAALITIVAGHIYGGGNKVHQNALNKGKHVWQTEHYLSSPNDLKVALDLAQQVNQLLNNWFSAYTWWWVNDGLAPNENLVKQSGEINLFGYVLGQFAKWIRPGYVRVAATYTPSSSVFVTAYVGKEFVVLAVNQGSGSVQQSFSVKGLTNLTTLTVHRTDGSLRMGNAGTVTVNANGEFTVNLPGMSVSTIHGPLGGSFVGGACGSTQSEGESLTLGCDTGETISSVDFASYGTPTGDCLSGFVKSACDSNTSMSVMTAKCVGQKMCTVAGSNDVFGDPCYGTAKHLAAKVSCIRPDCGATATEGASLTLRCDKADQVISGVDFASYGTPGGDCLNGFVKSTCDAKTSVSVMSDKCLGQKNCTVAGSNDVFGDPCSGTGKHLAAKISCAAPLAADVTCAAVDENQVLTLGCTGGKKISAVTFASYGTPSGSCPTLTKSSCHASSSQSVLESACVGKLLCTVTANNDVFGDPCSGTIKKLSAAITCA